MYAFDEHIRGEKKVLRRAARTEYGAIVADPEHHAGTAGQTNPFPYALD
jgi:hypothetical protein